MNNDLVQNGNRNKILDSTIELLLQKGYENVSMRDIAAKTGIKASSIYNHFQNKEQIIDEVIDIFRNQLTQRRINDYDIDLTNCDVPSVLLYIMTEPLKLFEDPFLMGIIRVITEGQHHHKGIRYFLVSEMFNKPRDFIKTTLLKLIDMGLIQSLPIDFLVSELQSVFIASFYRISLSGDISRINLNDIYKGLKMHVDFFYSATKRP